MRAASGQRDAEARQRFSYPCGARPPHQVLKASSTSIASKSGCGVELSRVADRPVGVVSSAACGVSTSPESPWSGGRCTSDVTAAERATVCVRNVNRL